MTLHELLIQIRDIFSLAQLLLSASFSLVQLLATVCLAIHLHHAVLIQVGLPTCILELHCWFFTFSFENVSSALGLMPKLQQLRGPAGEVQPLWIAKHSTTTELNIAVSSGEAGPSWPRAKSTPSAVVTAVGRPAGEARPPRFVKCSVTSEFEPGLAESPDQESSDEAEPGRARPSRKETVEGGRRCSRVNEGQQWSAQQLWDVPQCREWLVKGVRGHGWVTAATPFFLIREGL